jgi:hypothetical protein
MGTYWHKFRPTGCQLNYHPWTGWRLREAEKNAYASALLVTAGGEAGPSGSPEAEIRERSLPTVSPAALGDLKKKLSE